METNPVPFRDLTYIFLAALAVGLLAWRLRLPLILGSVFGGMVISPFTPGPKLSDLHSFEGLAEIGVVLLMFSIGVEFSIPDLMRVRWVALVVFIVRGTLEWLRRTFSPAVRAAA